jgi:hypothetical protein
MPVCCGTTRCSKGPDDGVGRSRAATRLGRPASKPKHCSATVAQTEAPLLPHSTKTKRPVHPAETATVAMSSGLNVCRLITVWLVAYR